MAEKTSIWAYIMKIFTLIANLFSKRPASGEPEVVDLKEQTWVKEGLLSPIRHRRYITIYCVANLTNGDIPIMDRKGNVIAEITGHSKSRLNMEGTGRLEDGRVINVDQLVGGSWNYAVMPPTSPHGIGIRGKALQPWVSLAHHKQQLRTHSLFGRSVIIPSLVNYVDPEGVAVDGKFEVHDIGGGLRKCPFSNGLWRTGALKAEYGQFDIFVGSESVYKALLGKWNSYREVIILPRDTETVLGIQETLNLLMDAQLKVDGKNGPNTKSAIKNLQDKAGLEETGEWCEDTKKFAEMSLNNWK